MKKNTTSAQLTHLFVGLFVAILLLVNIAFLIISSSYIYYHAKSQSEQVIQAVEENLEPKYDWSSLLDAYLAKQDDDAIILTTPTGKTYYSEDAHETFKVIGQKRHYQNFVFTKNHVYFLNQERHRAYQIHVAINVNELLNLITWLLFTMLGINIAAMLISIPLIRKLSYRWSRPIQNMNMEIKDIRKNGKKDQITVPTQPLEIKNLAKSFNNLLAFQKKALEREQQFVSDASHELKTPIAAIRGHVNLIKRRGKSNPEIIPTSLNYIDVESKKLETLVNELLTLGRIDHYTNNDQNTDLVKIVQEVISEVQTVYPHTIQAKLPNQLIYSISTTDFYNIVHNLIENAAKYSPENSDIDIILAEKDKHIIFKVADHGIGIKSENKDKIFERFYREDNSHSSKISGSGLGLAIVQTEVNKYHGKIVLKDNTPQGSIFIVSLPQK
ncbi:HAMP domain-containing sensor histidine kinase [Lactobacillus acidophilus]